MDDIVLPPRNEDRAIVIDGHSDVPLDIVRRRRAGERRVLYRYHLPAWQEGGVDAAILTVAGDEMKTEGESLLTHTLAAIQLVQDDVQEGADTLSLVTSAQDLQREVLAGRFAIALNVEGSRPLEGSLENLSRLYEAGIRFMSLTWNEQNEVGSGASCTNEDSGLTPFGRQVVRRMADLGMVTDLSHASHQTFWDAVALEPGNLVVSHSNAAALKPHARNISDEQIRAIADQGGYVGVCFYPAFLHAEDPEAKHVVEHIIHIAEVDGVDHVAIGPDYIDYALAEIVAHIKESRVDYGDNFIYPRGIETVRSLKNLKREMERHELDKGTIDKVLGENIVRFWRRVGADPDRTGPGP